MTTKKKPTRCSLDGDTVILRVAENSVFIDRCFVKCNPAKGAVHWREVTYAELKRIEAGNG